MRFLSKMAAASFALLGIATVHAVAQSRIVDATVHSAGLEHNLLGDPPDQQVAIYLPPTYDEDAHRRFPVVYFLHGFGDPNSPRQDCELIRAEADKAIAAHAAQPMIIVVPNGKNKYLGAFYANSSSTGNWDDYITRDVVTYIDSRYRTLASPEHRGIAGHSMGGYGALTLAFRHPDVFGSVYAMSPCCTDFGGDFGPSNPAWKQVGRVQSSGQVTPAEEHGDFFVAAFTAMDAALAPDPSAKTFGDPPFTFDGRNIQTNAAVYSRIAQKLPANMVGPLLSNIVRLNGIFIEYGAQDNFTHIVAGAEELSQRLGQAGVSHTLEVFQGDHGNRIAERVGEHMLPWMSRQIGAAPGSVTLNP